MVPILSFLPISSSLQKRTCLCVIGTISPVPWKHVIDYILFAVEELYPELAIFLSTFKNQIYVKMVPKSHAAKAPCTAIRSCGNVNPLTLLLPGNQLHLSPGPHSILVTVTVMLPEKFRNISANGLLHVEPQPESSNHVNTWLTIIRMM